MKMYLNEIDLKKAIKVHT